MSDIEIDLNEDSIEAEVDEVEKVALSNYENLENKPKINGVELKGNKTLEELGIQGIEEGKGLSSNDYTNEEKQKLASLENYDDTEIKSEIEKKQDKGDYALKSDLTNFVNKATTDLINYYLKTDTYTKTEVDDLISKIQSAGFEKVDVLPAVGKESTIYLVPTKEASTNNYYDEYIYTNNAWEIMGNTQMDLKGYATETYVNNAIANFLTADEINTLLNGYLKTTDIADWAKSATKPTYSAEEVGALPKDAELFSGDYNDLKNKPIIPTVPTNVSAFTNDAGYLTQHQDISGKQDKSTLETDVKAFIDSTYIQSLFTNAEEVEV